MTQTQTTHQVELTPEALDVALNLMASGMHMQAALDAAVELVELADALALELHA